MHHTVCPFTAQLLIIFGIVLVRLVWVESVDRYQRL